ncbi:MAG: hypothetical protein H6573_33285 [Lewinellaceae bacterium]|nr:hypothetical protein [Lewinellaceae bacterium]
MLGGARLCGGSAVRTGSIGVSGIAGIGSIRSGTGCGGFGVSGTSVAGVDGWAVVVFLSPLQPEKNTVKKTKVKTVAE